MEHNQKSNFLKNINLIEKISLAILSLYVFAAPLLFTTLTAANIYDFPKWVFTVIIAIVLLILTGSKFIAEKKITLVSRSYLIPLTGLLLAIGLSIGFSATNKILPLMGKGGLLIALVIIASCSMVLIKDRAKFTLYPLLISAFILSWIQILAFFGVLTKMSTLAIFQNEAFTPLGSQVSLATLLIITTIMSLVLGFKTKEIIQKIIYFLLSGIQSIAAIFSVTMLLPGQASPVKFLSLNNGWSIAIDQLKNWSTALFGVGPDNFAIAFTAFRPAVMNNTQNWFLRYSASSNELLTILTTIGIIGLLVLVLLSVKLVKDARNQISKSNFSAAVGFATFAIVISFLVMPANFSTLFLFFILVIFNWAESDSKPLEINFARISYLVSALMIIAATGLFYYTQNIFRAEVAFGQSLQYAAENKGTETYNAQIQAISLNPYMYRYRVAYSNTNLALANSLAAKEGLTDDDKQKITKLISQSIREAKASVALNPLNSSSWVNLASIYRQLINFAQGANQWAISSYIQAIRLDKTNPQLRLDLGGLLFSLAQYEDAIDQYKQSISLKPDFANAYYNLSHAYKQLEKYTESYVAMQNVVNLVDASSADYEKASQELLELQKQLPQQPAAAQPKQQKSELSLPEPVPSPDPEQGPKVSFNPSDTKTLEPGEVTPLDETGRQPAPESSASANPVPAIPVNE